MRADPVSRRYAEAVFSLAREQRDFEQWAQELDAIATVMSDPDAVALLNSVRVRPQEKALLIERTLAGVRPQALNLARLLVTKRRVDHAPAIRDAFRAMWDDERGIVHARAVTAVPLTEDEKARLTEQVTRTAGAGSEVQLENTVDPAILGGLILRIGDRVVDGSTRTRLVALRKRLEGVES